MCLVEFYFEVHKGTEMIAVYTSAFHTKNLNAHVPFILSFYSLLASCFCTQSVPCKMSTHHAFFTHIG